MEEKECLSCTLSMPITCFSKESNKIRNVCKSCRNEQVKFRRSILQNEKKDIPQEKNCSKCNTIQPATNFNKDRITSDGLDRECKECCRKGRQKKSIIIHDESITKSCIKCFENQPITNFKTHKKYADGHYNICNSCWKPREWNKEKQKIAEKKYCDKNKEKLQAKWKRTGQKENVRIKQRLSARIKSAFQYSGKKKINKTYDYIGCSYSFLRKWFEFQFTNGMSWQNMGQWHIDHVHPCASFNFENKNDINSCFNWKNLRPCWATENIVKGNSIITEVIEFHQKRVNEFLSTLPSHPGNRDDGAE